MSTDTPDPLAALFAPELADALNFALLLAYASGWSDAFDHTPLAIADARLAALVEEAAVTWQVRLTARPAAPPVPVWLAQLQEAHEPRPWDDK